MAPGVITSTKKAQGGTGPHGGANNVHREPAKKSAAFLTNPQIFSLSMVLGFSFYLLLAY
ncbi:hypothetical protein PHJA_001318400 [Phtheirospermum japonicum]|uniref:Uncharacterized protein n=1 Tax=Phtheirospermum japonicum TaxID=374723 RepID=A0A830C644_9LAMI|nr:hypothetical protein PHJA_001318400 [Phtheirospermum japonicum]